MVIARSEATWRSRAAAALWIASHAFAMTSGVRRT
jgi:hypothetical protein